MNEPLKLEAWRAPIRSTVSLKQTTKEKLDKNRAPGQCYDGFICQLVDLWEKIKEEKRGVMPI